MQAFLHKPIDQRALTFELGEFKNLKVQAHLELIFIPVIMLKLYTTIVQYSQSIKTFRTSQCTNGSQDGQILYCKALKSTVMIHMREL